MKIVLIGSGNVATHLGAALILQGGHEIVQVYSRRRANAQALAERLNELQAGAPSAGDDGGDGGERGAPSAGEKTKISFIDQLQEVDREADFYFICVSDQAIGPVIEELHKLQAPPVLPTPSTPSATAASGGEKGLNGIIVHTSGSTPLSIIADRFPARHGVLYPVQTFSKEKTVDFKQIPFALEASDAETFAVLEAVARGLSDRVFPCDSVQRQAIHVAAVFACNFTNYLYALGEEVLRKNGLEFDLIRPLILETAEKAMHHAPAAVQTGPAARKDFTIVQKHLEYLKELEGAEHQAAPDSKGGAVHHKMAEIYRLLSEGISGGR